MNDAAAEISGFQLVGSHWLASPLIWGLLASALGLWLVLSNTRPQPRFAGQVLAGAGFLFLLVTLPKLSPLATWTERIEQLVFWLFACVAIGCAAAAITARNPVYTAIWFAGSLLGVSGLFLFQNAQFLGVANVVVYAGAIVVTFLFVLMLANPEGHARYDQISWSRSVVPLAILSGALLVAIVAGTFAAPPAASPDNNNPVLAEDHMVQLGTQLFSRHLIAVEVAGTLLLVALVGAVAIVMQGKERRPIIAPPSSNGSPVRGAQP